MSHLLGFTGIFFISLMALIVAYKWPSISKIIIIALIVRVFFLLLGNYYFSLPDSTADAETYEKIAWDIAQGGFSNLIDHYEGPKARFVTLIIAIPYSLFGRSILMAKSISLFFGLASIVVGYFLARELWNDRIAKKVGWIMAFYPSMILYSVLTMREMYICFFILIAFFGVVSWTKTRSLKSILIGMLGFTAATFFHGGMFVGAFVFALIIAITGINKIFNSLLNLRINLKVFAFVLIIFACSGYYVSGKVTLPYLGNFDTLTKTNVYLRKSLFSTSGDSSYPKWTISNNMTELLYKVPVRSIYFVFAPFPWDIKKTSHLIGLIDASFHMYLVFLIIKNRKTIWKDPSLRFISIILLFYILVFAVAVGNFGTAIRHRTKFVTIFLLLAAPLVKKFTLLKKNKQKN